MKSITAANAHLCQLVEHVNRESKPLTITSQNGGAVLISEDDWQALQETLHLVSIPGMPESIKAARAESPTAPSLDW